eukprot:TRINITY_DN2598_c0_g1_i1.p1 TRINITY_DN2598_c0_g1~~TRINITY_DN2598_c0_g1_i1.p1  ORF type:complete len:353 (+),score=45.66 TRINITY_DN2598_c0_g1_i1:262-1320(+)
MSADRRSSNFTMKLRSQGPPDVDVMALSLKKSFKSPKFKPVDGVKAKKTRRESGRGTRRVNNTTRTHNNKLEEVREVESVNEAVDPELASFRKLQISLKQEKRGITYGQFYFYELGMLKEEDVFQALLFVKQLPELSLQQRPPSLLSNGRKYALPPLKHGKKKTLVLDLDETLVHASMDLMNFYNFTVDINLNDENRVVYVKCRPYLKQFLEAVSNHFEVVVFTASLEAYADKVLDVIDAGRHLISHRLFRDSCLCIQGNYLKNLEVLGRDPHSVVIVDNSVQAFGYQLQNAIPIVDFTDDSNDYELIRIWNLLQRAHQSTDIRNFISNEVGWGDVLEQLPETTQLSPLQGF